MFPLGLQDPFDKIVLNLKGSHWRRVRLGLSSAFSGARMRMISPRLKETLLILMDLLENSSEKNVQVDLFAHYKAFILDAIAGCCFGVESHDVQRDPNDPFLMVVKKWFESISTPLAFVSILFPEAKSIISFINNRLSHFSTKTNNILDVFQQILDEKRSNPNIKRVDLLQAVVDAADGKPKERVKNKSKIHDNEDIAEKGTSQVEETTLTESEIIAQALVFLFGGFETTARSMAYTSFLLAVNPEVQEKLYQEICSTIQDGEDINYDTLKKLPYLEMVFNETLRMYPPFPSMPNRECTKACTIKGVRFEVGTVVQTPVHSIHHDPELWENPESFNPERFSAENKSKIPSFAYLPFGQGPRFCVGQRFALLVAKLTLVHLVQRFRIVECQDTRSKFDYNFTPVPKIGESTWGVHVKLLPRLAT